MNIISINRKVKQIVCAEGQEVRIREWNDMAQDFGIRSKHGDIDCAGVFISSMLHLCGNKAIIKYIDNQGYRIGLKFLNYKGVTDYIYSPDMIEPI